ncbi:MAG TPA: right-handed parallel beta-helix repeat-containing protein [Kofleriaceae bacterium]|nr:right-handed parallel beta-helix repeat-containing protein [Kofleriaceae bacterium]
MATESLAGSVSVRAFKAVGDGVTDDRAAIQAALNSGASEVVIPRGTYLVGRGTGYFCLTVPAGVTVRGEDRDGSVLLQAPNVAASTRLLQVAAANVTIRDVTLDGNRTRQSADEHRAGVFATGAPNLTLRNVVARGFTGAGFYIYLGSHNPTVDHVIATKNARNGITFGGATTGGVVTGSSFVGNGAQQFDSEPGAGATVNGLTITGNTMDGAGASTDFVLTVSGSNGASRSQGWTIDGNTLNGATNVVWADNIVIRNNVGINPTIKPALTVYRTTNNITVQGNKWTLTQSGTNALVGVAVIGTGTGSAPTNVTVTQNRIAITGRAPAFGLKVTGASSVSITQNDLLGPGFAAAGYAGVYLRPTDPNDDFKSAVVQRNAISNWGAYGVSIVGNGPARLLAVDISGNLFDDTAGTMTRAVSLDDGSGAAKQISLTNNTRTNGVTGLVARYPLATPVLVAGQRGQRGTYAVAGTPEGVLVEVPGAIATHWSGNAGWRKAAGSAATGWAQTY